MTEDLDNELGRRLIAALLSVQFGLSSLDYTLKNYVPERVDRRWVETARQLLRQMNDDVSKRLLGPDLDRLMKSSGKPKPKPKQAG